jgi:hypothetical protein
LIINIPKDDIEDENQIFPSYGQSEMKLLIEGHNSTKSQEIVQYAKCQAPFLPNSPFYTAQQTHSFLIERSK